jgi:hypothetical protein
VKKAKQKEKGVEGESAELSPPPAYWWTSRRIKKSYNGFIGIEGW